MGTLLDQPAACLVDSQDRKPNHEEKEATVGPETST